MHKEMRTGCFLCHPCYLQLLYLGCLTHRLPSFVGAGGESLLVAKKSNSNQFKWELGAASCNPGQYVRLLQSSRNRAVNQSRGLASPQWKLGFLHWRWSSSLQRLQRLFLMWSHLSLPQANLHFYAKTMLKPVPLYCTTNGILDT